jgi:hypothetical protein
MHEAGMDGVHGSFGALCQHADFPEAIQVNTDPGTNGVRFLSAVRLATVTRPLSHLLSPNSELLFPITVKSED